MNRGENHGRTRSNRAAGALVTEGKDVRIKSPGAAASQTALVTVCSTGELGNHTLSHPKLCFSTHFPLQSPPLNLDPNLGEDINSLIYVFFAVLAVAA